MFPDSNGITYPSFQKQSCHLHDHFAISLKLVPTGTMSGLTRGSQFRGSTGNSDVIRLGTIHKRNLLKARVVIASLYLVCICPIRMGQLPLLGSCQPSL